VKIMRKCEKVRVRTRTYINVVVHLDCLTALQLRFEHYGGVGHAHGNL
jgi:hypothetical protein